MKEIIVDAKVEKLDEVLRFIDQILEEEDCPTKICVQMDVAVEEIFVNIAHYAYPGTEGKARITADVSEGDRCLTVTFEDSGLQYNPLEKKDPDITLSAEERPIGGLGIYMVKKSMDKVEYRYENGHNIFSISRFI